MTTQSMEERYAELQEATLEISLQAGEVGDAIVRGVPMSLIEKHMPAAGAWRDAARALALAAHWEACGCDDPEEHEDICYQVEERGEVVKTYYCARARSIAALGSDSAGVSPDSIGKEA